MVVLLGCIELTYLLFDVLTNDKTSKEFYYLGKIKAIGKILEFVMNNISKTAAEIEYRLVTLVQEYKIFVIQRGSGEFKGGWEFSGGKIEQGETTPKCFDSLNYG